MKITFPFTDLCTYLSSMALVVEDSSTDASKRLATIVINKERKVQFIGANQFIIYKSEVQELTYTLNIEDTDFSIANYTDPAKQDTLYIPIKLKDLITTLDTYKGSTVTTPSDVIIEPDFFTNTVSVTVIEVENSTGRTNKGVSVINLVKFNKQIKDYNEMQFPQENVEELSKLDLTLLNFYTDGILPQMSQTTTFNGMMQIGDDCEETVVNADGTETTVAIPSRVVCVGTETIVQYDNKLTNQLFKNTAFYYKPTQFINRVLCNMTKSNSAEGEEEPVMLIAKTNSHMCFKVTGKAEVYISYKKSQVNYTKYKRVVTHSVELNRQYFRQVLKRADTLTGGEPCTFIFKVDEDGTGGEIKIEHKNYRGSVPIISHQGMTDFNNYIAVRLSAKKFLNMIIGDEKSGIYEETVILAVNPNDMSNITQGMNVQLTDNRCLWYTFIKVGSVSTKPKEQSKG